MDFFIGKQLIGQGIQLRFASPLFFVGGLIGLIQFLSSGKGFLSAFFATSLLSNLITYFIFIGIGVYLYAISGPMMIKQDLKELEENSLNEEVGVMND